MCPTSNVQTKAVSGLHTHQIRGYFDQGIRVTVSTDSRTCSDTNVSLEMERIRSALEFTVEELWSMTLTALDVGFAPAEERAAIRAQYENEMAVLVTGPVIQGHDLP
jgi:adenosine deaminase